MVLTFKPTSSSNLYLSVFKSKLQALFFFLQQIQPFEIQLYFKEYFHMKMQLGYFIFWKTTLFDLNIFDLYLFYIFIRVIPFLNYHQTMKIFLLIIFLWENIFKSFFNWIKLSFFARKGQRNYWFKYFHLITKY